MQIKNIFLILLFILIHLSSNAQNVSGKITDTNGNPIPFATVYCKALANGTTSNIEGNYQLDLPKGEWILHYRYLGYKTKEVKIKVSANDLEMNVALAAQNYQLKEVKVLANGEDPANFVMRKAIAMGDYYTKQVSEYRNKVYLKGSGKILSVPRLFKKQLAKEGITKNKTFVTENISKIHFELPDKIDEEVISIRSSGLDEQADPMQFITMNLYNTADEGFISPLRKNAFSVYKFKLESIFEDQGRMINRIKITPKRKGKDLFRGYINIAEDYWNIHSADLQLSLPMTEAQIRQIYAPIEQEVWMPVSFDFTIQFKGLGFKFNGTYVASIKDYEITLNPALNHNYLKQEVLAKKIEEQSVQQITNHEESTILSKKEKKRKEEIKKLMEKEDINNAEMRKLQRLMEKENRPKEKVKEPLEIKIEKIKIAKDAKTKDSLYWAQMRPIPLSSDEMISFEQKDSIVKKKNTPEYKDSVRRANREFRWKYLLQGKTYFYKETNSYFTTPGLLDPTQISFNTVEGINFGAPFKYRQNDTLGHYFDISSNANYGFSREHLDFNLASNYRYNGIKRAWIGFKLGSEAVDFNQRNGINPTLNMLTSLYYKDNHLKLYDKNYIKIYHRTDLANGLHFNTMLEYANRKQLYNNSKWNIWNPSNNDYTSNIPEGIDPNFVGDSKAFTLSAKLSYTPHHRYYIKHGVKRMMYFHEQPTFNLLYKKSFKNVFNSNSEYELLEASVRQEIETGFNDRLTYQIKAGKFFSRPDYFADFKHFATSKPVFMLEAYLETFRLLDYYQHSTNDKYLEGHLQFSSDRLLLKRLPILNNSLAIQEKIFVNYLTSPNYKNYWEVGYGLSQIFLLLDIEVFCNFKGKEYQETGLKIKLNL